MPELGKSEARRVEKGSPPEGPSRNCDEARTDVTRLGISPCFCERKITDSSTCAGNCTETRPFRNSVHLVACLVPPETLMLDKKTKTKGNDLSVCAHVLGRQSLWWRDGAGRASN